MKLLEHFLGVLCAFCLMIIFLITSVEAVAYWTPGYYEHEYSKYNVTEAVRMEMDDLLEVTDEMNLWILDARTDLLINIVPEPFFMDTAARIGITFAGMTALLFAVCAILIKREHKQK